MPRNFNRRNSRKRFRNGSRGKGYRKRTPYMSRVTYMKNSGSRAVVGADAFLTKMQWVQQFNIVPRATPNEWNQNVVIRGNSLFDPSVDAAVSTQPAGFSLIAPPLYERYKVSASSIKLLFANITNDPVNVMLVPSLDSAPESIVNGYSNSYSKIRMIGPNLAQPVLTMNSYMSTVKMRGEIEAKYDDDYGAAFNANPGRTWYWHIVIETAGRVEDIFGNLTVIVTYYTKFTKRTSLNAGQVPP